MSKRNNARPSPPDNQFDPLDPSSGWYVSEGAPGTDEGPSLPPDEDMRDVRRPLDSARSFHSSSRRSRTRGVLGKALVFVLFLAAAFIALNFTVFQIRRVEVTGNRTRTGAQVAELAGLTSPVSYFSLNRADIEKKLSADRYLVLTGLEKRFPSGVVLSVRERALCANVQFNSIWYLTDEEGFVLEKLSRDDPRNTLPKVTGIQVRDARVGYHLVPARDEQLASYRLVMAELLSQGYVNEISEINVGDSAHVYLVTRDPFTADIGWADQQLMARIAVLRGVVGKLRELGRQGGMIDLTDLEQAIYSP